MGKGLLIGIVIAIVFIGGFGAVLKFGLEQESVLGCG